MKLAFIMKVKYSILVSGTWHRVCFTPAFIMTKDEVDFVFDRFIFIYKEFIKTGFYD